MNELLLEKLQVAQKKSSDCFPLNILEGASAAMQRALLRTWLQTLGKSLPSYGNSTNKAAKFERSSRQSAGN